MQEFIISGLAGALLIALCGLNVYEILRACWRWLPRLTWHPRLRAFAMVAAVFISHIINIWIFGLMYYVLMHHAHIGTFSGTPIERGEYVLDVFGCVYLSTMIYSTVGMGDITPEGAMRMIAGVEALTGFLMIGWTVSFTYLAMQKFWELPHYRRKR